MRTGRLLAPALLASALVVAACGSSGGGGQPQSAASKQPIVVGFTDALSGSLSYIGQPVLQGLRLYLDTVNASGGVNGRQIKLDVVDSQADNAQVVSAVRNFAGENAVAVLGFTISGNAEAAAPVLQQLQLPMLSGGTSPKLLSPVQPDVFSDDVNQGALAQPEVDFAAEHLVAGKSGVRVALYSVQTAGVAAFVVTLKDYIAKKHPDWQIVSDQVVPLNVTDASVAAAKIVASKPDVVLTGSPDKPILLGVQSMTSQGLSVPIVGFHGSNAETTFTTLKDPGYYAARQYPTTSDSNPGKGYEAMIAAFRKAGLYNTLQSSYSGIQGYLAGLEVVAILKHCGAGCNSGAAFQKAAESVGQIDTGGITFKPVVFSPQRHQGVDTVRFYHYQDGKLVAVGNSYSNWLGNK